MIDHPRLGLALGPYQRLINPWQTDREIGRAIKTIEAMLKGKSEDERRALLGLDDPPRWWPRHGDDPAPPWLAHWRELTQMSADGRKPTIYVSAVKLKFTL